MAIFKCKMCGGTLEISADQRTAVCQYCGTEQTLPRLDDDRRANLYDRANHFRRNNEFDKAMGIYEQLLNEDGSDAEAYWSIVLCRYGIEYVEDPSTHKRLPTVNRAQYTSIFNDEDYKAAVANADPLQRSIYEAETAAINEIQKNILTISQKEDPFDVFICYKETDATGRRTQDSVLANDLYHQLVQEGFKVFFSRITLEDKLGAEYEPYIFAALNSAKVMVVLGTKPEHFNAVWVKNEWSRYLALIRNGAKKTLIPAYRDMDPYDLPEEFSHLQAQDMSKLGFMQDLIRGIKKILDADKPKMETVRETTVIQTEGGSNLTALLKRGNMALEDGEWEKADGFFEQVLNMDAECADAYLGKWLVEEKVTSLDKMAENLAAFCDLDYENALKSKNYERMKKYANKTLSERIKKVLSEIKPGLTNCVIDIDQIRTKMKCAQNCIFAGWESMAGIKSDHTLQCFFGYLPDSDVDEAIVDSWKDIVSIVSLNFENKIVVLTQDGRLAFNFDTSGSIFSDAGKWTDIKAVSCGFDHIVGLKADGTVIAAGENSDGQGNVSKWKEIVSVSASVSESEAHTVGLRADGTVVATGSNRKGQCNVESWSDIVSVCAGCGYTIGLRRDGTVVATGDNSFGQCDVSSWNSIISIATGGSEVFSDYCDVVTVGLHSDGTVSVIGDLEDRRRFEAKNWRNVVAISAGQNVIAGVKSDGSICADQIHRNSDGHYELNGIKLFNCIDTLEEEWNALLICDEQL